MPGLKEKHNGVAGPPTQKAHKLGPKKQNDRKKPIPPKQQTQGTAGGRATKKSPAPRAPYTEQRTNQTRDVCHMKVKQTAPLTSGDTAERMGTSKRKKGAGRFENREIESRLAKKSQPFFRANRERITIDNIGPEGDK